MPNPRRKKRKPPLEKYEDIFIRKLYRTAGCSVITFSQAQKAQQTPGIPDMRVYDPRSGTAWWHEIKRQSGPEWLKTNHGQTEHQVIFQRLVESFGEEYLIGARDVAEAKLREIGRLI